MGLVNKPSSAAQQVQDSYPQIAANDNDFERSLMDLLTDNSFVVRRKAVKSLRQNSENIDILLTRLPFEDHPVVVEAIFDTLLTLSGDLDSASEIVEQIIPLLTKVNPHIRNSAILFLSTLPRQLAVKMPSMLASDNKDMQLYALDILRNMSHVDMPQWLGTMLQQDLHPNVLVSLLDRISDCQALELLDPIRVIWQKYREDPMLAFSAQLTIERLGGHCE